MLSGRLNARINRGNHHFDIKLSLLKWNEDNIFYVYAPALDLTGYGNNQMEAEDSFKIMLEEFIKYTDNKKTIYKELERLGWMVNKRKKRVHPPEHDQMLEDNETFRELSSMPGVKSTHTRIELALA